MIRFASDAAQPSKALQSRELKAEAPSAEMMPGSVEPVTSLMLIPELSESLAQTPRKTTKSRAAKKPKTTAENTSNLLDLNG